MEEREVLKLARKTLALCSDHPWRSQAIAELDKLIEQKSNALTQPEQEQLRFEVDGEMLTVSQMMGVELFNFQQATGCDTAAEFLAQSEPPDLDAICQDLQEKTYNQAMRIAELEAQLAQPEQEPVAFVKGCNRGQWEIFPAKAHQIFGIEQPLYTTPPQRTWVNATTWRGLTDEEVKHMLELFVVPPHHVDMVVQAIEAKLKEKNT